MRPSDADDIKYLYAAWRMGKVSFEGFKVKEETPEAFTEAFVDFMSKSYQLAFTIIADVPNKGVMPVGIIFGILPFIYQKVTITVDYTWFPWATPRNKLEGSVHFFNQMRKEWVILGFADMKDVPFFEHVCRYGVLRRVGTVFDLFGEGATAMFQTRKPYKGVK